MNLVNDIHERRQRTWEQMKSLLDTAEARGRDLSAAEEQEYQRMNRDLDSLDQRLTSIVDGETRARQAEDALATLTGKPVSPLAPEDRKVDEHFRNAVMNRDPRPIEVKPLQRRMGWQPGVEKRTLSTATGSGMVPTSFYDRVILHAVDNSAILAAGATVLTTETGESLKVPRTSAFSTASIVTEGSTIGASDPTLGTVQLDGYKYAFLVQVTNELVRDATFDVQGFVAEQAGIALGNGFGAHAITGTGSSQPNGIVTGATTGITGGTGVTGAFTADNLIDLYHSLAEPYARSTSAAWMMKNATLGAVRKLKDSQNRYLFDAAIPAGLSGASGMLLGRPIYADPNFAAVALNAKSVLFGDISKYWVRMVGALRFETSFDFAFDTDKTTFRCIATLDGDLIDTSGACKLFVGAAT